MERKSKENYYLDIAEAVLARGTCIRRNYGAVIVKNDMIVSTGYAGAPRGRQNCSDAGACFRKANGVPSGERYEMCRSVHAEANAIIAADRDLMLGATLYLTGHDENGSLNPGAYPCAMCQRLIINAGISRVICRNTPERYTVIPVRDWVEKEDDFT
jgi:dCMP deaminase